MATDLAPLTPAVLKWARENSGVSVEDAAKRAVVPMERIIAWEVGEEQPTVAKLRQLAKLYGRPLAVFFLPEPPREFDALRDFRKLSSSDSNLWSRALHKLYRRAIEQREVYSELLEAEGEKARVGVPPAALDAEPEEVAHTARAALGVSLQDQFRWRQPAKSWVGWLHAVENLGNR